MIREVLRMGDPRLLQRSVELTQFNSEELKQLLTDMRDTMAHLNGAGLAAPQIGVLQRVVIFGVHANPRYPDVEEVPDTVLINPRIEPLGGEMAEGWEGCLSVPGMRGWVPRWKRLRYSGYDERGAYQVLSIVATDRPGLLYGVARILARYHVSLQTARINTLGDRAEDVFLVSGEALASPKTVLQLEQDLVAELSLPAAAPLPETALR